ncbi:MAG: DUF177 domain-containing protein [Syntrophales bacterium]|jgi:uncharacterized protein|nr:DUF177 domain-containing protein [Syntrophales bacterium]MDY0044358.1 DUF177 domain-containing protein [Syntrophales bacterium]
MQIIVSQIPPEGLKIHIVKDGDWFRRLASGDLIDQYSVRKVEFKGIAERVAKNVAIKGEIVVDAVTQCSRCLDSVPMNIESEVMNIAAPAAGTSTWAEKELEREELDLLYYENDTIDMEPLIFEQMLLLFPIKTLCDENCRGLCPVCGINLNRETCNHKVEDIKSPLEVLKNFKITKNK